MIPTQYKINSYEKIPQFSAQELSQMIKNGKKIALYGELVVDLEQFNHPGGTKILNPFVNNIFSNIKDLFEKYNHSRYADVLLCMKTIGKLKISENVHGSINISTLKGRQLFEKVERYNEFKLHKKALQKIDFSKPIYNQLNQLSVQEKQCLIDIPTYLENHDRIKFKQTQIEEIMYTNSFWRSTICFHTFVLLGLIYLLAQSFKGQSFLGFLPFLLFGIVKWTLLEYYFHRFRLHYDLSVNPSIESHLMHHAFPNMRNKIALSIFNVFSYMVVFYLIYSLFLQRPQVISVLLGILIGLTLYDVTHYYFHFGPEINVSWLVSLKRNHLKHHFRDPNRGFGVSNTIWDTLFKTEHLM